MKNIFSFNINESSELSDVAKLAQPYAIRQVDEAIQSNQKAITDKMDELEKKWRLPTWLSYIKVIAICIGVAILACYLMMFISVGFSQALSGVLSWSLFICGIALFFLGVALFVTETIRRKRTENSSEYKNAMKYIERLSRKSESYLKLPEDKVKVDVFFYPFVILNDKEVDNSAFKYLILRQF